MAVSQSEHIRERNLWRLLVCILAVVANVTCAEELQFPQVLAYHQIAAPGEKCPPGFPVMPCGTLESQFRYLAEHNIRTLTIGEYIAAISLPNPPTQAVLVTFDDGYRSMLTQVYPLLAKYDLHAVSFVIASCVGAENKVNPNQPWLTWEECRVLQDSGRVDIEAHGFRSHTKITSFGGRVMRDEPFLTARLYDEAAGTLESDSAYRERIYNDLLQSRTIIEDHLRKRVKAFAWPFGRTNEEALLAAHDAGFLATFGLNDPQFPEVNRLRYHSPEHWAEVTSRIEQAQREIAALSPTSETATGTSAAPGPAYSKGLLEGFSEVRLRGVVVGLLAGALIWLLFSYLVFRGKGDGNGEAADGEGLPDHTAQPSRERPTEPVPNADADL